MSFQYVWVGVICSFLATIAGASGKLLVRWSWKKYIEQEEHIPLQIYVDNCQNSVDSLYKTQNCHSDNTTNISDRARKFNLYIRLMSSYFILIVVNPMLSAISLAFAPPNMTAPIGALTLVWVIIGAPRILNESARFMDYAIISTILVGEVGIGLSSIRMKSKTYNLSTAMAIFSHPEWRIYQSIHLIWIVVLVLAIKNSTLESRIHRISWSLIGGSLAGNLYFATLVVNIISYDSYNILTFEFMALVVGLIFTALLGMILYTISMKWYDALYMSSTYIGTYIIFAAITSEIAFNALSNLEHTQFIMYMSGILCIVMGTLLLVYKMSNQ